jgi:hypothetical protein
MKTQTLQAPTDRPEKQLCAAIDFYITVIGPLNVEVTKLRRKLDLLDEALRRGIRLSEGQIAEQAQLMVRILMRDGQLKWACKWAADHFRDGTMTMWRAIF